MIRPPNEEARLIALGAYFASEHFLSDQMVALANERDRALAEVQRLIKEVEHLTPVEPVAEEEAEPDEPKDTRVCRRHLTERWSCAPLATETEPCLSFVDCPGEECKAPDPHWHDDLNTVHPGLVDEWRPDSS